MFGMQKLKYLEWSEGSEVKPKMTVYGQFDRAIEQISNIMTLKTCKKDKKHKILRLKHSSSSSGKE